MISLDTIEDTNACFRILSSQGKFGRLTNKVLSVGAKLLDEFPTEIDEAKYKKILIGTMIVAMGFEDQKYKCDEYPDYTIDQLYEKFPDFKAALEKSLKDGVLYIGEKALTDCSLCQGNFRDETFELAKVLPDGITKQLFGHRAEYEKEKLLKQKSEPTTFDNFYTNMMWSLPCTKTKQTTQEVEKKLSL